MTHRFNVKHPLVGLSLQDARELMVDPAFQEEVARTVPGFNLNIMESTRTARGYRMRREVNMDANIPDLAKKFLKDAFKVWRTEDWVAETLTCYSHTKLNMPAEFRCTIRIVEHEGHVVADHDWEVDVHVPLIHGVLARHAESEIRRFNQIEIDVIRQIIGTR